MGRKSNAKKQKNREMSVFEYLLKLGFMYDLQLDSGFDIQDS